MLSGAIPALYRWPADIDSACAAPVAEVTDVLLDESMIIEHWVADELMPAKCVAGDGNSLPSSSYICLSQNTGSTTR